MNKYKFEQILLENKPIQVSLDEIIMCADIEIDYIEKKLNVSFESGEGQGGPIRDCILCIEGNYYVYIHKWEMESENYTRFNTESLEVSALIKIKQILIELLELGEDRIQWLSSKVK